LLCFSYQ